MALCSTFSCFQNEKKRMLGTLPTSIKHLPKKRSRNAPQTGLCDEIMEAINELPASPFVCVRIQEKPWVFVTQSTIIERFMEDGNIDGFMTGQPIEFYPYAKHFPRATLAMNDLKLWKERRDQYLDQCQGGFEPCDTRSPNSPHIKKCSFMTDSFFNPAFEKELEIVGENVKTMFHTLEKDIWKHSKPFDFYPSIRKCMMDTFLEIFIGCRADIQLGKNIELHDNIERLVNYFPSDYRNPREKRWFHCFESAEEKKLRKAAESLRNFVQQKMNSYKSDSLYQNLLENNPLGYNRKQFKAKSECKSLLEFLTYSMIVRNHLVKTNRLTVDKSPAEYEAEIIDQTISLFLVGYGATTSTTFWTLYNITIDDGLQSNIRKTLESRLDKMRIPLITAQNSRIDLMDKAIRETIRLFPPMPFYMRILTENLKIGKYEVPKDTMLAVSIRHIHTSTIYKDDPLKFKIYRFDQTNPPPKNVFLPFGYGDRNCLGADLANAIISVTIANILHRFRVNRLLSAGEKLKFTANYFLKPTSGHRMQLTPLREI